jgi:FlgD Ig-like domain
MVLMLALLAGTTTAFVLTEALKLDRTPIARPKFGVVFSPVCMCYRDTARLPVSFRRAETIDAVVLSEGGDSVRTLAQGRKQPRGRFVFLWDGRDDTGRLVDDGSYRLRLTFDEDGRTIELPNEIRVDTTPPTLDLLSLEVPEPGSMDPVTASARSNEKSRLLLYLDGRLAVRGTLQGPGVIRLVWAGAAADRRLSSGHHALTLVARDYAGNRSLPTDAVTVPATTTP